MNRRANDGDVQAMLEDGERMNRRAQRTLGHPLDEVESFPDLEDLSTTPDPETGVQVREVSISLEDYVRPGVVHLSEAPRQLVAYLRSGPSPIPEGM